MAKRLVVAQARERVGRDDVFANEERALVERPRRRRRGQSRRDKRPDTCSPRVYTSKRVHLSLQLAVQLLS